MSLAPGTTLGRYQILEPLGQGGMAVVYKAYQPALDRVVALKVIRKGFAEDPEFRDRFGREARAIARLVHPNIVQVHDFEESDGQVYLAMQYLEGGTLKDRLSHVSAEGRRMDQDEVARIIGDVGKALRYAHDEGVIHRDVKPSNVMLTKRGDVVVTDFGIAKIVGGTQHTATGVGIGTPEYMSPEQGQGQKLDGRTDQYALAVTAYEMLTGTLPYTADTPFAVVLKHVRDPLPLPSKVDSGISARTEQVLLRALAKDPAGRYPTVTDFAAELARTISEGSGRTLPTVIARRPAAAAPTERVGAPAPSPFGPKIAVAAAGFALLLLGGGSAAVLGAFGTAAPTPTASSSVALVTSAPTTIVPPTTPSMTVVPATTPPPTTPPPTTAPPTARPATTAPVANVTTPLPSPSMTAWALAVSVSGSSAFLDVPAGVVRADYDRPGFRALGSDWMSTASSPIDSAAGRLTASIPAGGKLEAWITGGQAERAAIAWPGTYACTGSHPALAPIAGSGPFLLNGRTIICTFAPPSGPGPHALGVRFEAARLRITVDAPGSPIVQLGTANAAMADGTPLSQVWWVHGRDKPGSVVPMPIGLPLDFDVFDYFAQGRRSYSITWDGGTVACRSSKTSPLLVQTPAYVTDEMVNCDLTRASASSTYTLNIRIVAAPSATLTPVR